MVTLTFDDPDLTRAYERTVSSTDPVVMAEEARELVREAYRLDDHAERGWAESSTLVDEVAFIWTHVDDRAAHDALFSHEAVRDTRVWYF